MLETKLRTSEERTISILDCMELYGYLKICEHINRGEYDEAGKVVALLERVGVI